MKNMSFSHNHTALNNKHYQAADFCSALRIKPQTFVVHYAYIPVVC